jgi:hypothetical protein
MRSMLRCLALLPLLLFVLAPPAHADPMDDFSIIGGGATIDFSLPASTTQACLTCIGSSNDQFNFGSVTGTVNNISQPIGLNFVIGSGCAECGTVLLSYPSTSWTIYLPDPTSLYGITYSGTFPNQDVTLTFIPGDYMTNGYNQSFDFAQFEVKVTPEAAATPEPPTLYLSALAAASLCGLLLMKRRVLG